MLSATILPGSTELVLTAKIIAFPALAWIAFGDIVFFFGVILVGFAYLWKRGDLNWVRSLAAQNKVEA